MQKILSLFIVGLVTVLLTGCWETETGERTGAITEFKLQGGIKKTWEGKIVSLTFVPDTMKGELCFTVEDMNLIKQVDKARYLHQPVRITYRKESFSFWSSDNGGVFLTSIEPLSTALENEVSTDVDVSAGAVVNSFGQRLMGVQMNTTTEKSTASSPD